MKIFENVCFTRRCIYDVWKRSVNDTIKREYILKRLVTASSLRNALSNLKKMPMHKNTWLCRTALLDTGL